MIKIKTQLFKIRPLKYWTALADEATDTFISVFGHAVGGAVVVVIGFAMTVVSASLS